MTLAEYRKKFGIQDKPSEQPAGEPAETPTSGQSRRGRSPKEQPAGQVAETATEPAQAVEV